jgi:hypothetical protein
MMTPGILLISTGLSMYNHSKANYRQELEQITIHSRGLVERSSQLQILGILAVNEK